MCTFGLKPLTERHLVLLGDGEATESEEDREKRQLQAEPKISRPNPEANQTQARNSFWVCFLKKAQSRCSSKHSLAGFCQEKVPVPSFLIISFALFFFWRCLVLLWFGSFAFRKHQRQAPRLSYYEGTTCNH